MSESADPAGARRHLNAVRRLVLEILAEGPLATRDEVAARWAERKPQLTPRHQDALPRMAGEILWRLENLGWVERADGVYRVTDSGRAIADL